MQNGTLHIAPSLFSIFHRASSISKPNMINILLIEEALWKMKNIEAAMCSLHAFLQKLWTSFENNFFLFFIENGSSNLDG